MTTKRTTSPRRTHVDCWAIRPYPGYESRPDYSTLLDDLFASERGAVWNCTLREFGEVVPVRVTVDWAPRTARKGRK